MNVLALDTTGEALSAALLARGRRFALRRAGSRPHDETLLPAVERLLARAGLEPRDLSALVVASGPGRFTGIRIGMSYAAVAAGALGIPALALPRFEAVAWKTPGPRVCAAVEGWKGERFYQLYRRGGSGAPRTRGEPVWVSTEDWPRRRDELAASGLVVSELATGAEELLEPALERLARKRLPAFAPLYLKPAGYERKPAAGARS